MVFRGFARAGQQYQVTTVRSVRYLRPNASRTAGVGALARCLRSLTQRYLFATSLTRANQRHSTYNIESASSGKGVTVGFGSTIV